MSDLFASIPVKNSRVLCVGGITTRESTEALTAGFQAEPSGIYLFLASACEPSTPIEILAKFFSVEQAERAAENLPTLG